LVIDAGDFRLFTRNLLHLLLGCWSADLPTEGNLTVLYRHIDLRVLSFRVGGKLVLNILGNRIGVGSM
jgi:hypothetical protein